MMENAEKVKAFEKELVFITNPQIRKFAENAIEILPDYFFEVPASSTGKYHPSYALGNGGLLRHTRSAIRIAMELFRMDWWHFTEDEKDLIIVSLIMHDGWKSGVEKKEFTIVEHPNVAFSMIKNNEKLQTLLPESSISFIVDNIRTHMGQWTKDFKTGVEVLDRPQTKHQKFVHLADYIASRKCLEMNFDAEIRRE